jgi:hypothetical protein
MSSTEAPISITAKTAAGTLVTLRAETAEDLGNLVAQGIFAIADAVKEIETNVRGAGNAAVPPSPAVAYAANALGATIISEQHTPAAGGGAGQRMCPHGTMTRIHGLTGKFGPYKGHFCPAQQGDPTKCTTQYVKQNQPEWNVFQADQTKG